MSAHIAPYSGYNGFTCSNNRIVTGVCCISPTLVWLLYDEHIELSAAVFIVLCVSFIGMCISYTLGALLTANKNLKQLSIMSGLAVISSIVLNLILVPRYKVMGAAIANASTALFTIFFHLILVYRVFKVKLSVLRALMVALFVISILVATIFLPRFIVSMWLGIPVVVALAIILSFVFRLLKLNELIDFVRVSVSAKKTVE
jgi:O-antigen/teichoic acid export membrane protein